ncbi:MAG: PQQ-binding-like beta-propeller repeat protein [Fuerstiella sp.]
MRCNLTSCFRLLFSLTVLVGVVDGLAAQPPLQLVEPLIEPDDNPGRRQIEQLILQVQESAAEEPLKAAELFDAAWELAVRREDPLIDLKTEASEMLSPGRHRVDAGSRATLQKLFTSLPDRFRKAYQEHTAVTAETAVQQAVKSGDLNSLADVILRYQFTRSGQQALEGVIRLRLSRGEYLQAALQYGRLLNLSGDRSPDKQLQLAIYWWNAGLPEEAVDFLKTLVRTHAGRNLSFDGQTVQLPESGDDLDRWLEQLASRSRYIAGPDASEEWTQPLGNYRRTRLQSTAPAALKMSWQASAFKCVLNEDLDELLQAAAERIRQQADLELDLNNAIAPAARPLVVGDLLIFRGVANIRAVNRHTGELVWESSFIDPQLKGAAEALYRDPEDETSNMNAVQAMLTEALFHHLVRDNGSGQLTCSGNIVFAVEEATPETMRIDWDSQTPSARRAVNYLRAHDLESGQTLGYLGGTVGLSSSDAAPNPLKGFYVLGAPLVIGERIYLMAENDQGIFLLQLQVTQLDQVTPPFSLRPVTSQLLSVPRYSLRDHPVRMYSGVTPSYGQGLLICNTCDEKIIAVSAEDHSVRWVYRYPTSVALPELGSGNGIAFLGNASGPEVSSQIDLASRWQDALPRIVDGRILVTPRDSDRLICLELQTGRQIWSRPRGRLRRIVFADSQRVVLTGTDSVECLTTDTGEALWETQLDSGHVCGTAVSDGRALHVPVSVPAIVTIDLRTGRRLLSQPVSGGLPGNLLSIDGRLYSQSLTEVSCFSTPDDTTPSPLNIASRQLLQGEIDKATDGLQAILKDSAGSSDEIRVRARRLLIETLLESLRMDFRGNADSVPTVQRLISEGTPRSDDIARLTETMLGMTLGDMAVLPELWSRADDSYGQLEQLQLLSSRFRLQDADEPAEDVAAHILSMLDQSSLTREGYARTGSLIRRNSRATAAAIQAALSRRDPDTVRQIRKIVNPELLQRLQNTDTATHAQWWVEMCLMSGFVQPALDFCAAPESSLPADTASATIDLVRLAAAGRASSSTEDADQSGQSAAQLLDHWWTQGRTELVGELLRRTQQMQNHAALDVAQGSFRPTPAGNLRLPANSLTAEQLSDRIAKAAMAETPIPWQQSPAVTESVERSVGPAADPRVDSPRVAIPVFGDPGTFPRWAFVQKLGTNSIAAYDSEGRERWTFDPDDFVFESGSRFGYSFNRLTAHYAVAHGTLLALKIHHMLYVLDCADANAQQSPKKLWSINIFSALPDVSRTQQFVPAWQRTTQYDIQPGGLFPVGPLTPFGIPVYSGRRLIFFNTLSGRREWQVDGLPEDCVLTANDHELLLISESSGSIETRSLIDGSVRSSTVLPDWWTDAGENSNSSIRDFEVEPGEQQRWRISVEDGRCLLLRRSLEESALESFDLVRQEIAWSLPLPQDSVVSNVVDGHIAVLSDGDRLQIMDTIAGRRVADLKVASSPGSRFLYLRPASGNWLVFTDVFDQDHDEQNPVGANTSVQVNGHVYAVDQRTGEEKWTVEVDHRWLRILNPAQSPFPPVTPLFVLLQQPYRRGPGGLPRGATVQAAIYDTRTGRILYEDDDLGYGLSYHCVKLHNQQNTIEVAFDKRSVTFDYSHPTEAE